MELAKRFAKVRTRGGIYFNGLSLDNVQVIVSV